MGRRNSSTITDVVLLFLGAAAVLGAIAGVGAVVYFWWYGVLIGMEHFGIPMLVGFLIAVMLIAFTRGLGSLALACLGLWASVVLLDMWWFWAFALYATTLAVLFVGFIIATAATVMAFFLKMLEELFSRR